MDSGQHAKASPPRAVAKPPQGLNAAALDKKLQLRKRARDDDARNLPRHDAG